MESKARLLLILLAMIAVGSGSAIAQLDATNYFTLNPQLFSTAYDADCLWVQDADIITLGLYLYDPVNPAFGPENEERPVQNIGSFECRIEFTEGAFIMGWTLPSGSVNAGTNESPLVYFDTPVPVLTNPVLLGSLDVFFGGDVSFDLAILGTGRCVMNYNVFGHVHPRLPSRIYDHANYTDADDTDTPLVGGDCADENVDFRYSLYDPEGVENGQRTWDSLKALYR